MVLAGTSGRQMRKEHILSGYFARMSPLKVITLPRSEICGATISSRLFYMVRESIDFVLDKAVFWYDSTIVIAWFLGEHS